MIFKKKTFQTFEHSLFQMDWISSKIVADQLYVFFSNGTLIIILFNC